MPIAQVISRPREVKRRAMRSACGNSQKCLSCGFYFDQAAIVSHQHITSTHHMAALQKNRQHTTAGIFGLETTLLSHIPIQGHRGRTFDQSLRQTFATRN
jgi:hypothetical protein